MLRWSRGLVVVCLSRKRNILGKNDLHSHFLFCAAVNQREVVTPLVPQKSESGHDLLIKKANIGQADISSILTNSVNKNSVYDAFQTLQVIADLVGQGKVSYEKDIKLHKQFTKLMEVLEKGAKTGSPVQILSGLRALMSMGFDANSHLVQSLENQLLWNVRRVPVSTLLSIFIFQKMYQATEIQKKVLDETLSAIKRRWVEIKFSKDITTVFENYESFAPEFISKIDDRTIELSEKMSYLELSKIFCTLGQTKRRVTPVLRTLAFHMAKNSEKLTPKQLSNILFAMNILSYYDQVLLEKLASDLVPQIGDVKQSSIIGSILVCMGQMRWRHSSLLEVLSEWIETNLNVCRINDISALILTMAYVSYSPNNSNRVFPLILSKLDYAAVGKESLWLDIVWSLGVLDMVTSSQLASILNPVFVSKLPQAVDSVRTGVILKLLNVNAIARQCGEAYTGSYLDTRSTLNGIVLTQSRSQLMLAKHVRGMLHNFLPPPKYILENIQTSMGVLVDVELAVDKTGSPIPIEDYTTKFGEAESRKDLPDGAHRVALFVWDYKDYAVGSQELIGIHQLAVKLIQKQGYKVVQIPFYEYNIKAKTLENVQYLQSKIRDASLQP